jgi:hypothetical protein
VIEPSFTRTEVLHLLQKLAAKHHSRLVEEAIEAEPRLRAYPFRLDEELHDDKADALKLAGGQSPLAFEVPDTDPAPALHDGEGDGVLEPGKR